MATDNDQDKNKDQNQHGVNVNTQRRKQLLKYWGLGAGAAILLVAGAYLLMGNHAHPAVTSTTNGQKPNFISIDDSQFNKQDGKETEQVEQETIVEQQHQIATLIKQQQALSDQLKQLSAGGGAAQQALQQQVAQLSQQLAAQVNSPEGAHGIAGAGAHQIQVFSVHFASPEPKTNTINAHNYVPAATLVRAVLLGAADANASVTGQTDTIPVIFRLLDNGLEPTQSVNGSNRQLKAPLKGCSVIGSTFGDISSERAEVRLVRLSCNRVDGSVLDIPVQGTVYEGLEGIKGTPVMRNGPILAWAGLSGFISGLGQSFQQAATTQTATAAGMASAISPGSSLKYGAYGGVGGAFTMLSQYWIQRAEQYHPIIEIKPGTLVTIAFTEGFSLTSQVKADNTLSHSNGSGGVTQNNSIQQAQSLMQQISSGQAQPATSFGQTINQGGAP